MEKTIMTVTTDELKELQRKLKYANRKSDEKRAKEAELQEIKDEILAAQQKLQEKTVGESRGK